MIFCEFKPVDGRLICGLCGASREDNGVQVWRECPAVESAPLAQPSFDCIHRGRRIGKVKCKPCGGARKLNVFRCSIHGECTVYSTGLTKADKQYKKSCVACEDRENGG